MSRRPPRRADKPPTRNAYAGPSTCLRCDDPFWSWDRRQNRLCPRCREAINADPSDESIYHPAPRRSRYRDEG